MQESTATISESPEVSVYERYAAASQQVEPALCCPVQYVGQYLKVIPQEDAAPVDCRRQKVRDPRETKGACSDN